MIRQIMPWQATGPGDVTILRAPGRRLTKLITEAGVVGYDRAAAFESRRSGSTTSRTSPRCSTTSPGRPTAASSAACSARVHGPADGPAPVARPPRRRRPVRRGPANLDHGRSGARACPPGVDPTDPVLVGGALRRHLPAPFRSARCVAQLSSQAGLRAGLRGSLVVPARPAARAGRAEALARARAGRRPRRCSCRSSRTTSPRRSSIGVDDPCFDVGWRSCPDIPRSRSRPCRTRRGQGRPPRAGAARHGIGPAGAERYAAACLRRLALAPEGRRHPTCVAVSCRLLALAKAGLLDPVRVAAQIKGVMRGKGFDGRGGRDLSEIDSILSLGHGRRSSRKDLPMSDDAAPDLLASIPARRGYDTLPEFAAEVARLAACRSTSTSVARKAEAKRLGVRVVDARRDGQGRAPAEEGRAGQGSRIELPEIEPWADPVDGAELIADMVPRSAGSSCWPEQAAVAVALWVVFARAHDAAFHSPRLAVRSPVHRCGKSTLLRVSACWRCARSRRRASRRRRPSG